MSIFERFAEQSHAVQGLIDQIGPEDWGRPGLGEWTIAELVAHLVRAADRIPAYLDTEVEGTEPVVDRVSYFRFDHAGAAAGVADRSRQDAARLGTDALAMTFRQAVAVTLMRCGELEDAHLIQTFNGPMALEEYAATRVLELVVHGMDLARALGQRPQVDSVSLAVTAAILDGLCEGDRPTGMDDATWVMAATGRDPHPDERLPGLS